MSAVTVLLLLDTAFVTHLFHSTRRLPEKVACHFRFDAQADGWMSRRAYLSIFACMGPGLSALTLIGPFALRNAPVPLFGQHLVWFGCLFAAFIFGVHELTVRANLATPPRLPMKSFWSLIGALQIGLLLWVLTLPG